MQRFAHPAFVISVILLLVNDFIGKPIFHNEWTGKLSDFAGLFAFAYFFGAIFYSHKRQVHLVVAALFLLWKSPLITPFLDWIQQYDVPMGRVVDYTDYIALVSLIFSYRLLSKWNVYRWKPFYVQSIMVVACFSFVATTQLRSELRAYEKIDKEYRFKFSKRELVSRLNDLQIKTVKKINITGEQVVYYPGLNRFSTAGVNDTLGWVIDTPVTKNDTIVFKTSYAVIHIAGDDQESSIKVLTLYKGVPMTKKGYRRKAIKEFKHWVVDALK